MVANMEAKYVERFWSKVNKHGKKMPHMETRCWEWTKGKSTDGYGMFWCGDKMRLSHRISYRLCRGLLHPKKQLDHKCRNKCCVRPDHLRQVTLKKNQEFKAIAQKACPNGHDRVLRKRPWDGHLVCAICYPPRIPKTHCAQGHEYDKQNTIIRNDGSRKCRECHRIYMQGYNARKRAA